MKTLKELQHLNEIIVKLKEGGANEEMLDGIIEGYVHGNEEDE